MNSLAFLLAPVALLLPALTELPGERPELPGLRVLDRARETPVQHQVRIEQRVIIRITPSPREVRDQLLGDIPRRPRGSYQEEKLDGCIPINAIAGVMPSAEDNRLLLFMRDRRVLSAALERSCRAQDYFQGFYIERREDGQLCARRDKLQSRAGASCEVAQLNRLVATRD